MANCFVIATEGARARMFVLEKDAALRAGSRLVEKIDPVNTDYTASGKDAPRVRGDRNTTRQAGTMHPQHAERERHRIELEHRFVREIAAHATAMVRTSGATKPILVAEPRMLGLIRRPLHATAGRRVTISEIAYNHTRLMPSRLQQWLAADELIWQHGIAPYAVRCA